MFGKEFLRLGIPCLGRERVVISVGLGSEFRGGVEAVDEDAQQGIVEPVGVGFLYYKAVFKEDSKCALHRTGRGQGMPLDKGAACRIPDVPVFGNR